MEVLAESGLVEALGNGRRRNYMFISKVYGAYNTVPMSVELLGEDL